MVDGYVSPKAEYDAETHWKISIENVKERAEPSEHSVKVKDQSEHIKKCFNVMEVWK